MRAPSLCLSSLMAVSIQNGGDLQLDQLLQAMAGWLGSGSMALGTVHLVELVIWPMDFSFPLADGLHPYPFLARCDGRAVSG